MEFDSNSCRQFASTLELFAARKNLEIWIAPGDSELQVAYNNPDVVFIQMKPNNNVVGEQIIKNNLIGFQGEVYDPGEEGFRTWRKNDGTPARPEVQGPRTEQQQEEEELRAPTDQEMEQIQKALEGKDINEIYKEQEKRRKDTQQ